MGLDKCLCRFKVHGCLASRVCIFFNPPCIFIGLKKLDSISNCLTHISKLNRQHKGCRIEIFIQTINLNCKLNKFEFFQSSVYSRRIKKIWAAFLLAGHTFKK